ncbi:hypothetical protein, partial [Escherichia coli]|uniref:hypothetical protein n=2 Tax=Escherichia coli TaxID=562 RepID=UPI003EBC839A
FNIFNRDHVPAKGIFQVMRGIGNLIREIHYLRINRFLSGIQIELIFSKQVNVKIVIIIINELAGVNATMFDRYGQTSWR